MKSLQESLFDSKTQTMESLFDKDLVEKGVSISFETLRDMLFSFGRKRKNLFDKNGVIYHEGRQSIFIKRFIDDSKRKEAVCFYLELGVTNTYNYKLDKLIPTFNIPVFYTSDRMMSVGNQPHNSKLLQWSSSRADYNITFKEINKKLNLDQSTKDYDYMSIIAANSDNIIKVFDMYDKMVKYFCSNEFKEILQNYVDKFEFKHVIPGLVTDILMKKLISKS